MSVFLQDIIGVLWILLLISLLATVSLFGLWALWGVEQMNLRKMEDRQVEKLYEMMGDQ